MASPKILGILVGGVLTVTSSLAWAQDIPRDLERLQRDLQDLQRFVYGQNTAPQAGANTQSSVSGGPEFNARIQRSVQALQTQVRTLTGQLEETQFNIRRMQERLDKLVTDIDIRLQNLELAVGGQQRVSQGGPLRENPAGSVPAQPLPQNTASSGGTTFITSTGVVGAPTASQNGTVSTGQGPAKGILGTIGQSDIDAVRSGRAQDIQPVQGARQAAPAPLPQRQPPPAPRAAPVASGVVAQAGPTQSVIASLPAGTPQEQYSYAFGLLKQREYQKAAGLFRQFVEQNPDNPLSGNAMYWMGETYYVQKDFTEAARIFLDGYQRYPTGSKAPDNLLKLAMSLMEVGETKSACAAFGRLLKSFPNGNQRLLSTAKGEADRLKCS